MTVSEILEKTGQSGDAILREHFLLTALSKRSRYVESPAPVGHPSS
jgi:hypothetical protein